MNCKICGTSSVAIFQLPIEKATGHPIVETGNNCTYYRCNKCDFCFTDYNTQVYDENYWNQTDVEWYGRILETYRLVALARELKQFKPWEPTILDFGCGIGKFVQECNNKFGMKVFGTDIGRTELPDNLFIKDFANTEKKFDIIISCEVLEHLEDPIGIFNTMKSKLNANGIIAFQTAYYCPINCKRDWWYFGPANGHISLYSIKAFTKMYEILGGQSRILWNNYPGIQAWRFK